MIVLSIAAGSAASGLARQAPSAPDLPPVKLESFAPNSREQLQQAYQAAVQQPRSAEASGRVGMLLHSFDQFEPAIAFYQRARALDPASFNWTYYLGLAQAGLGRHAEAAATFQAAVQQKPDYLPAQLKLAESLLAAHQLHPSQQVYETLLSKQPDLAAAHYGLGRVKAAQGEMASAAEHYQRAGELYPAFGAAHYALGLAYRSLGQMAKAQEHLRLYQKDKLGWPPLADPLWQAVRALNDGALAHLKKGVTLGDAGQLAPAIAEHEKAVEINPELVQAHINLISLYGRLGQMEPAIKHYRAAVALNPNSAEAYYNYGVLLVGQNRFEEAAAAFEQSLAINPNYAEAHHNYAVLLERAGKLAEASRHYQSALENQPNHRLAHFHLGRILVHQNRLTEAITHLRQTLTPEDDNTPRFMYALAAVYARSGDRANALQSARGARDRASALGQTELLRLIERDLRTLEQMPE